jgi:hypothetical protein
MTEEERQSRLLLGQQLRTQAEHRSEIEMRQSLSRMYYAVYHVAAVLFGREYSHQEIAVKLSALEGGDYLSSSYKQLQVARSKANYHHDWISREFGSLVGFRVRFEELILLGSELDERMRQLIQREGAGHG